VYCSITGFGQTGPYRDRPGYDYVIQAMSGLMSITGPADGMPHKVGVAISDVITGLFAVSSILAALRHAESTGQGQYLDVSLLDSQIAALVNIASNYLVSGQKPARLGNEHPNIVPYQVFRASDSEFVVAVGNDRQFAQLCLLIGQPGLAEDGRFATNPSRVINRKALIPILENVFLSQSADYWVTGMLEVGIPAGPIHDIPTALNNPHIQARGLIHKIPYGDSDILKMVAPPVQFSETQARIRLPPPHLGQHTDEILRDVLDIDDLAIETYRAEGVI
jgi:formyl-CoA transferase